MTTLAINGSGQFTLNGTPTFLLMASYFDGIHARESDLDVFVARRINCLRVFLDWVDFATEDPTRSGVWSFFNSDGTLKAAKSTLLTFIRAADAKGLTVELVILNGVSDGWMTTGTARTDAVTNAVTYFGDEPNVFFDVVNEAEQCAYITAMADITALISTARAAHATVILAASVSAAPLAGDGPLLDATTDAVDTSYIAAYMGTGTQLCSYHTKGNAQWWYAKGRRVANMRAWLDANGYSAAPIHINEDNRWDGYGDPGAGDVSADQYLTTMLEAQVHGAASCIHHASGCFDLSSASSFRALFAHDEERDVFDRMGETLAAGGILTPLMVVDTFNRADAGPPPSADWIDVSGNGQKVLSNQLGNNAGSTTVNDASAWGARFYKNQRVRAQLAVVPRNGVVEYAILAMRVQGLYGGYDQLIEVEIDNITTWRTRCYLVSGGYTQLEATYTGTINANDVIELEAIDGTVRVLINDVAVITALDVAFVGSGYVVAASFNSAGSSAVRWNNVEAGAIYTPPPFTLRDSTLRGGDVLRGEAATGPVEATGSASGVGAGSGVGAAIDTTAGAAGGSGSASGGGAAIAKADGASAGTGVASGAGSAIDTATGAVSGAGAASGAGQSTAGVAGASAGSGATSGQAAALAQADGAAAGVSAAAGAGEDAAGGGATGSAAGSGSASGSGAAVAQAAGSAAGTATVDAAAAAIQQIDAASTGAGSAIGQAQAIVAGEGTSTGLGGASGSVAALVPATGEAAGQGEALAEPVLVASGPIVILPATRRAYRLRARVTNRPYVLAATQRTYLVRA